MGCWARVILAFLALQSITTLLPNKAAAGDLLPPLLQPIFKEICKQSVWCGKGTCLVSSESILGFVCNCNSGWTQFHIGDDLRFLPCIIPNCSVNYSCNNDSTDLAPSPLQHHTNFILSDPCLYSYCGGGTCVSTSSLKHRCECKDGFSNLLNQSSFPCYRDCSFGVDCANLGIPLPKSSPPTLSNNSSSSGGDMYIPSSLLWMTPLVIPVFLAVTR